MKFPGAVSANSIRRLWRGEKHSNYRQVTAFQFTRPGWRDNVGDFPIETNAFPSCFAQIICAPKSKNAFSTSGLANDDHFNLWIPSSSGQAVYALKANSWNFFRLTSAEPDALWQDWGKTGIPACRRFETVRRECLLQSWQHARHPRPFGKGQHSPMMFGTAHPGPVPGQSESRPISAREMPA